MGEFELKPCPFCGGTEQRVKSSWRWGWFVSCKCCAVGPSATSRDEAIAAWNNREGYRIVDNAFQSAVSKWAHADAENADLRELVRDMWRFTGTACKKYPRLFDPSAQGGQTVQLNQIDSFEQRMRELGIEAEE